jgi:hypothetical protein
MEALVHRVVLDGGARKASAGGEECFDGLSTNGK